MRLALAAFVLALSTLVSAPVAHAADDDTGGYGVQQPEGRSGFWTSRAPAKGGAYRWRLLGIGVGLVGITGFIMLRLIKNANNDRNNRK